MRRRGGVIANYPLVRPLVRPDGSPRWVYCPTELMGPDFFMDHAERYHREGREAEGTIIIDECHRLLNSRTTWTGKRAVAGRQYSLVQWLAESRHWGFDVILVIQNLNMLDKQVRDALIQERVKHFKWNSFWFLKWFPIPIFGRVTYNAQFKGMRGRLSFSTGFIARGRYDHLWQRKAVTARRARLRAAGLGAPSGDGGVPVGGAPDGRGTPALYIASSLVPVTGATDNDEVTAS
jgi:hypothetical protein